MRIAKGRNELKPFEIGAKLEESNSGTPTIRKGVHESTIPAQYGSTQRGVVWRNKCWRLLKDTLGRWHTHFPRV
jgi:hypothetical protein